MTDFILAYCLKIHIITLQTFPIGMQTVKVLEVRELHYILLKYRSRALKSRPKLRAAIGLRAEFEKLLLHQNSSLCTVTFGEKVLTLPKSPGSCVRGYGMCTNKENCKGFLTKFEQM